MNKNKQKSCNDPYQKKKKEVPFKLAFSETYKFGQLHRAILAKQARNQRTTGKKRN
jgi:hypothetical protein